MNDLMKVTPEEFGLEAKNVKSIEDAFTPKIAEREGLANIYEQLITEELTPELCEKASDLRKKLVRVRTGIAEVHKTQKAFFLASGKFVDAWKNKETLPVTQMEEKLSEIEKHFENIEKERLAKIHQERVDKMTELDPESPYMNMLGTLTEEAFEDILSGTRARIDREKAEAQKIEDDRLAKEKAEQEERARIAKENEQLRKEAEEKEVQAKKERQESEKKANEAKAEANRLIAEEKAKADKLAKELQDKKDAEEKAEANRLLQIEADLKKGDSAKMKDLISDLAELKTKYEFKSVANKKAYAQMGELIDKVINFINK